MTRFRWPTPRHFALSAVAWTAFIAVNVLSQRSTLSPAPPPPFWPTFVASFQYMVWWIPTTPFLFRLVEAIPLVQRRWPAAVLFHVAFAGFFAWGNTLIALYTTVPSDTVERLSVPPIPWRWVVVDGFIAFMATLISQALVSAKAVIEKERAAAELAVHNADLSRALTQAQLQTLRYRLQPHFLHNALNSVVGLVRRGDRDAAITTLIGVSELLRQVADEDGPLLVPLERELAFVERYLEVEQVRFGDRMTTSIEATDEAKAALVPSLLLQPLVENAVRHGVGESMESTRVGVDARVIDRDGVGRVVVEIWNDGPDIDDAELATSPGVGLKLTLDRLEHAFGDDGRFDLVSKGGRVISRVSFPRLDGTGGDDVYEYGTTGGRG